MMGEEKFDLDREIMKFAMSMYKEALSEESDSDYEMNPPQMEVFIKTVKYFKDLIEPKYGESVEYEVRSPKEQNGYITVEMELIDFTGEKDKIEEFCKIVSESSSFDVYPVKSGRFMRIGLVIPDLYIKKANPQKRG